MKVDDWAAQGRRIKVGDETLFWRREGSGEPLLLLHAYPTASWGFYKIWDALTAEHDVIAVDLPGSGLSSKSRTSDYSVAGLADAVEAFCAAIDLEAAHVLSHAYASTVGQEILARMQDAAASGRTPSLQVLSACFINAGLFPEVGRQTSMQKLLLSPLGPLIATAFPAPYGAFKSRISAQFGPERQPSEAELEAIYALLSRDDGRRLVPKTLGYLRDRVRYRDRYVGALTSAPAPVGLVCGTGDAISGDNVIRRWRELLPSAPLVVLPDGVGHYPPLECPEDVVAAYRTIRAAMDDGGAAR